jgi:hypothetical protein
MSDEFERIWREVIRGLNEVISCHFLGGTGENHEKP